MTIDERNRPLEYPEQYLWFSDPDGHRRVKTGERLGELLKGAEPMDEVEELLAANRKWLRIYMRHAIGNYVISIESTGPFPKWDKSWLKSLE